MDASQTPETGHRSASVFSVTSSSRAGDSGTRGIRPAHTISKELQAEIGK